MTHVSTLCQHMKRDQHLSSKASRPKKVYLAAHTDAAYHVVHLMIKTTGDITLVVTWCNTNSCLLIKQKGIHDSKEGIWRLDKEVSPKPKTHHGERTC